MNKDLHTLYPSLYGSVYDEKEMDERFSRLIKRHEELYGKKDPALFSAAGRTEIAGNHTDHNLGLIIGASINLDTIAAVTPRDDSIVVFSSEGFPPCRVDITDDSVHEEEKNTTPSLLRGIAKAFRERGVVIGGWEAAVSSSVMVGSGLSSSASVEVLIAEIFNSFYNGDRFKALELAKIGQFAENVYFGKPSGLLDQACCATGGIVGIDFKDKADPVVTPLSLDLSQFELTMVITNTHGTHADLTDEYSAMPGEMREVAHYFGKENLREVEFRHFISSLRDLREKLKNDRALLRAYHYFTENERVVYMLDEIRDGDIDTFLYNVNESGTSSFCFLQNVYTTLNTHEEGLALAIALSQHILRGEGAVRVHGGGFAGTIQAYVPDHLLEEYIKEMEGVFGTGSCTRISFRKCDVCRIM